MSDKIKDKYDQLFQQFGQSNKSLGWGDKERSNLRFKILTNDWNLAAQKVLDFGCGFGALKDYILANKTTDFNYLGIDISENFISIASKTNTYPNAKFELRNLLVDELESNSFDYAFVSGTFNDFRIDNYDFVATLLAKLNKTTRKGIAMNFLSSYAEIHHEHASYSDPSEILKLAYSISKNIILRNDYMPYEFTVLINKEEQIDSSLTIYQNYLPFI